MENSRRLGNLVISRQQLRWLLLIAGASAVCYFVLAAVVAGTFYRKTAEAAQRFEVEPMFTKELFNIMQSSILSLTAVAFLLTAITVLAAIVLSHRFFGPIVPIKRFISSVRAGDYSVRLSLRDADQLHEVARELNEMVVELEKRHAT